MQEFLSQDVLGLASVYRFVVILHIFGVAIGAGAAFFSDFLFVDILKDRKISREEFRILKLASRVVWIGLAVLILSGLIMYSGNTDLIESSKFQAKMTIVAVLTLNGLLFHFYHLPMLAKAVGKNLAKSTAFKERSLSFFISGAVSGVSWAAAIVLGGLGRIDLSYLTIMAIYVAVLIPAGLSALKLRRYYTS